MLAIVVWCAAALADGRGAIDVAGVSVVAPVGFTVDKASETALVAKARGVELRIEREALRLPADEATARGRAELQSRRRTRWGATDLTIADASASDGRTLSVVTYTLDGAPEALADLGVPVRGGTVHVVAIGPDRDAAVGAIDAWATTLVVTEAPDPLPGPGGTGSSANGLSAPIPGGWRLPLDSEHDAVAPLVGPFVAGGDPDRCWSAIRPQTDGEVAVLVACVESFHPGPIDAASFAHEEAALRAGLFGERAADVDPATPTDLADRTAVVWRADPPGGTVLRVAAAPFGAQTLVVWGTAPAAAAADLDAALDAVLRHAAYPDVPRPTMSAWAGYVMRRFGLLFGVVGGTGATLLAGVAWMLRPKRGWEKLAD